jgi:biopolymer transport protein ExbD
MKFFTIFITICLLVSCDRTQKIPQPAGLKSSDLPTANHSRQIEEKESQYIEIVVSEYKSELFHHGKWVTTTTNTEDLLSVFKKIRDENNMLGYSTPLLISAPASTPFTTIVERIRTAAEIGIYQILFLVRSDQHSESRVVHIELPSIAPQSPKIEPFFLHITSEGRIYNGTGSSRILMDRIKHEPKLERLSSQLKLYSSAAEASGTPYAPCQIYIEPKATYQRVIDVISLTNKYHLKPFITDMLPEPEPEYIPKPRKKPSPPSSGIRPLGLAPIE